MLIAPTEPSLLKALGNVSLTPEKFGADVLFTNKQYGLVGIQRKEIRDLIASVQDGRLAREMAQMQRLGLKVLVIEGRPRWSLDGEYMDSYVRWPKVTHRNLVRSVQAKGVWVETTDSLADTCDAVMDLKKWVEKPKHSSLDTRPKPTGPWGKASQMDYSLHILQGVDGVGPGLAESILKHFGKLPLGWTVTKEELMDVPGIGKKKATKLWDALHG